MPLPDERPRQSVANLIGRFEQQGKRQTSPALPVVTRSSSVSSQLVGDAAKEEVKEKREWPPKPMASADIKPLASTLSSSPSPSMSKSPVASPQPIPDPPPPVDVPTTPTPPSPEPVTSPPSKGKAIASGKSVPTTAARRAVASPAKSRSPAAKSSANSPPSKTSLQSSVSQPIRPQHTGQSVASNPSATRQTRQVPRTAPSTPARPKSSAAQHQAVSRPKTPSSGLFAPTAASLARSRNAPPPPPPPVKKATLSSDAAERLSKPTAASLSKARTPVPTAPNPARVAKSASAGPHCPTPRGPSKLKGGRTPARPKEPHAEGVGSGPASVSSEPSRASDQPAADHAENGHDSGTATFSDVGSPEDTHGHSEVVNDEAHDPAADQEDVRSDPGTYPERQAGDHPAEEDHSHEHVAQNPPLEEAVREHEQVRLEVRDDTVPEPTGSHTGQVIGNGNSHQVGLGVPGNEIEDIVNLLEGTSLSKPRPQSIVSIPDEDGEVLDEY